MTSMSRGFTLIEVAVVVLVVALLLGSLLVPLNAQVEQRNVAETQKSLDEIKEALYGYAMICGRLPRPAQLADNGVEQVAACTTEVQCTGFVPWVTLGVSRTDAWGRLLQVQCNPRIHGSRLP